MKIVQNDINLLWNDMETKSWESLGEILKDKVEDIDEDERLQLMVTVGDLRDEPFPESEVELFTVLTHEVLGDPQKIWITSM